MSDLRERVKAAIAKALYSEQAMSQPSSVDKDMTAAADAALEAVAAHIETQRRDVPAHGWEFAAALRAEAQTEKTDE